MKALDTKLMRDLTAMWSQVLTIGLVAACGVAGVITSFSLYDSIRWTTERFYDTQRFAHVFAELKRAPLALREQLARIEGVQDVEVTTRMGVTLDLEGVREITTGIVIGINAAEPPRINALHLREGTLPARTSATVEVVLSDAFAQANHLKPGTRLHALLNGRREALVVSGTAFSPEYIFAGMGGAGDERTFGVLWMDAEHVATAYDMQGAFNNVALRLAPGASADAVIREVDRVLTPYGGRGAYARDEQISHRVLTQETNELRVFGTVFPAVFMGVAAFLLNVVLSRLVATQRAQIAALKAVGYDNLSVGLHYLAFATVIMLLGIGLGLVLGVWLGRSMLGLYEDVFRFPRLAFRVRPDVVLLAALVSLAAAFGGVLNAVMAVTRLPPAEAMRPPYPARFTRTLAERIGLEQWLTPAMRMVVRNLERRYWRTALTTLGIASAMAITISGMFWLDAIEHLIDITFHLSERADVTLSFPNAVSDRAVREVARLPGVTEVEGLRSVSVKLVAGHASERATLVSLAPESTMRRVVNESRHVAPIPTEGLLLTDRLAQRLGVKTGNTVSVEVLEGDRPIREARVAALTGELMGLNAYISEAALRRMLSEPVLVNGVRVRVEDSAMPDFLAALKGIPKITTAENRRAALRNFREQSGRNLTFFSLVLTAFATTIAVGVVYNSARIALAERAWELASLRVLGFTRGEVSTFLLGELAVPVALAIPVGWVMGNLLAGSILKLIHTDLFSIPLVIYPSTYAYATLTVLVAAVVSALIVRRRIDTLDLVGVLKTRE